MKLFQRLGIDLGTANSIVYVAGKGIVLNEPTVVAVSLPDRTVVAVGNEAKQMLGRTPGNIIASRPMRDGVIADYVVTEAMLRYFIRKVMGRAYLIKPDVMVCVPAGCTQVEQRAVMDATFQAGARHVYLIDEPLAAAIGAGLPIGEPGGNMIVDIGGGAAEAAVISLGGVVVHQSTRVGGNKLDEAIAGYIRKKHNLIVGDQTAEWVKIEIGDALSENSENSDGRNVRKSENQKVGSASRRTDSPAFRPSDSSGLPAEKRAMSRVRIEPGGEWQTKAGSQSISSVLNSLEVKGRDAISGLPRTITVTASEVTEAMRTKLLQIIAAIKGVLEQVPPELSSDIIDRGIVMSGGTSLLRNFPKLVTAETGVPAYVAEDALLCVAKGTGIALDNLAAYKRAITAR